MRVLARYFILGCIFFISLELSFKLKYYHDKEFYPSNKLTPSQQYDKIWTNLAENANAEYDKTRLFLIGDSFFDAEEYGGKESYVPYFSQLSLKKNWDFFNLSLAGTSIENHRQIWNQINDQPNNIYVFSIKVHDVTKLTDISRISAAEKEKTPAEEIQFEPIDLLRKSDVIYLLKDLLHQLFMWFNHTPLPNTHLYKSIVEPSDADLDRLAEFLCYLETRKGKVIILVNYPYNFRYKEEKLDQFKLFRFFDELPCKKINVLQSPTLVNKKESVDWRNVHPNSTSMKAIFNHIKEELK